MTRGKGCRLGPTAIARLHYIGPAEPRMAGEGSTPGARYSYTVNGVTYESTRWRFGSFMSMSRRDVEQAMSTQIKPSNPVVFYDPSKPSRSCLVAGPNEITLVGPVVGSVLVVALNHARRVASQVGKSSNMG